jgi:hypothetical protein
MKEARAIPPAVGTITNRRKWPRLQNSRESGHLHRQTETVLKIG